MTRRAGHATRQDQTDTFQHHQALRQRRAQATASQRRRLGRHGGRGCAPPLHRARHRLGRAPRAGSLHGHRRRVPHRLPRRQPRADLGAHRRLRHHRGGHRGRRRHRRSGRGHHHRRRSAHSDGPVQAGFDHPIRALHHHHRLHCGYRGHPRHRTAERLPRPHLPRRRTCRRDHGQAARRRPEHRHGELAGRRRWRGVPRHPVPLAQGERARPRVTGGARRGRRHGERPRDAGEHHRRPLRALERAPRSTSPSSASTCCATSCRTASPSPSWRPSSRFCPASWPTA